ncbi:hypothetical protein U1Q18_018439 [Sarracenia purpurea var. burkii]
MLVVVYSIGVLFNKESFKFDTMALMFAHHHLWRGQVRFLGRPPSRRSGIRDHAIGPPFYLLLHFASSSDVDVIPGIAIAKLSDFGFLMVKLDNSQD